jgi:opacity protein-like surface antigen
MIKNLVWTIMVAGTVCGLTWCFTPACAVAENRETQAQDFTQESVTVVAVPQNAPQISVHKPIGVKINAGYFGTKIADPGWRYISSSNWLKAVYIEGAYTLYNNVDVFANYGYSQYSPSQSSQINGVTANFDLITNIITVGARYSYPLWRWTVPYAELGVSTYVASVSISDQQSITEHDVIVAPEITAGFYIPLKVPTATSPLGINLQFSFGLVRQYFVKPLELDFGYLGNINVDGQRLTIGFGFSF